MAVSKDWEIRKTLRTAEVAKHVRLGSEGLHVPPHRLQKQIAPVSPQPHRASGTDEMIPLAPLLYRVNQSSRGTFFF